MNFTSYKYPLLLLGSVLLTAVPASANSLEDLNHNHQSSSFYPAKGNKSDRTKPREYTFKAPDSKVISNSEQLTKVRGYKVEVNGNADDLLQQVRDVEPAAFIKGDIIQVGIFGRQDNAEDLVRQLAAKGLWARIVAQ